MKKKLSALFYDNTFTTSFLAKTLLGASLLKDTYSIPRIQDTLHCLRGAVWFTLLELKCGYWQVELEEANKALTAFTVGPWGSMSTNECHLGWWMLQQISVPHGDLLGNLQFQQCIIYLDDVILFAATLKEHLKRLCTVLSSMWVAGLKL